jgi:hypothetical protein
VDFEEDIDVGTLSVAGGTLVAKNLTKWYATRTELKWDALDTHAAVFAWDSRVHGKTARIDFKLPPASPIQGSFSSQFGILLSMAGLPR